MRVDEAGEDQEPICSYLFITAVGLPPTHQRTYAPVLAFDVRFEPTLRRYDSAAANR
jgi:hypothetical protein